MKPRAYTLPSLLLAVFFILGACSGQISTSPSSQPPAGQEAQSGPSSSGAAASDGVGSAAPASPSTGSGQRPSTGRADLPVGQAGLPETFSGQAAYRHVEQLALVIGSRPTGTAKEQAAAEYIAAQLSSYGYKVELQPFEFETYEERESFLQIAKPSPEVLSANALFFSPGGDVTGALVLAGLGRPEDFPPPGLAGNIALIERGTLSFADKVANAAWVGARGVIVFNNVAGEFRGSLGNLGTIPAVGISREEGQQLVALTQQGPVQARLSVDAGQRQVRSRNVIARAGDTCRVVVGGHYDSVPAGPGANDNASGIATTLEVARVLRGQAKTQELCFVAFGGEELGLWGSRRFVESLSAAEKSHTQAMINLDMVGVGDRWRVSGSENLRGVISTASAGLGVDIQTFGSGSRSGGSDHASFLQAGISAVFIHRQEDPNYHTAGDQAEFVDPSALQAAGDTVVEIINQLAGAS